MGWDPEVSARSAIPPYCVVGCRRLRPCVRPMHARCACECPRCPTLRCVDRRTLHRPASPRSRPRRPGGRMPGISCASLCLIAHIRDRHPRCSTKMIGKREEGGPHVLLKSTSAWTSPAAAERDRACAFSCKIIIVRCTARRHAIGNPRIELWFRIIDALPYSALTPGRGGLRL